MRMLLASTLTTLALLAGGTASAAMDRNIESALIDVCKKISSDRVIPLRSTVKGYNLSYEVIGEKLLCNGYNVIAWAQINGAERTADDMHRVLGTVTISDLAKQGALWEVNYN